MVGRRFWWFWQIPNICIPENISTRVDDAMVGAGSFRSYVRRHWICSRRPCGSKCPVGSCRMSTGWCHSYPVADPGWENWSNRTAWRRTGWKRNILWDFMRTIIFETKKNITISFIQFPRTGIGTNYGSLDKNSHSLMEILTFQITVWSKAESVSSSQLLKSSV